MAGCYHDKHDFKSDLDIEVAREGDILEDGQELDEMACEKNPGHRGFIPFKDLTLDHLPSEIRNKETLDGIKRIGSIVVRIKRGRLVGSGYVKRIENNCEAPLFRITTNNHVVNTDDDVRRCTVEFHYDSNDMSSVVTSKGVKLLGTCPDRDITTFLFYPIPDFLYQLDWNDNTDRMPCIVIMYKDNQIVSDETIPTTFPYPSITSPVNLNNSLIVVMFLSWPNGSISYIKSPYFKFKPMTSNIKSLPCIDIHIDDDNGKSRAISGDIVKFGDECVVKIADAIFQDEVKKCRLVWNGEVIGRGTTLYFEKLKPSEMFSDMCEIDTSLLFQNWSQGNVWLFDCNIPEDIEETHITVDPHNVCCIGHPHGSMKMVTFGYILKMSLERFDNQGRRIDKPGKHCQCKKVSCYNYSCKTCKGSSGSPVFIPMEKPDLLLTHFMGKRWKTLLPTGEQIENINSAWFPLSKQDIL